MRRRSKELAGALRMVWVGSGWRTENGVGGLDAFDGVDVDDHLAHCLVNDELRIVDFVLDAEHQI